MATAFSDSSTGSSCPLPDVRIVLLGNREAGKSSAGNTILGREEFDPDVSTLLCVKRQGEVAGRQLTVVDTPGWTDYDLSFGKDSPNLLKQELVLSGTLCPPGPHAFLLVVHENMTFTEAERNATSNHLILLGHEAWKHSLVLFIQETPAQGKAFEVKGKMLQWLVEKCGNRYHVLNIKEKGDVTQVTQLLDKISGMATETRDLHYRIERRILEETKERRMREEERTQERRMDVQRQRGVLSTLRIPLPQLRIVLLGYKESGKSSSGNSIIGRKVFQVGQRSAVCVKRQGEVAGRQVTLVEAPGWFRYCTVRYSSELTKGEIVLSQALCGEGPHCVLLVVHVDAGFTERKKISVQQHLDLLSPRMWGHTIVLFTHGDRLGDTTIEQYIESEGEHLKWLIERCGNRYHVLNNRKERDSKQITELLEKVEEVVVENRGQHYEPDKQYVQNLQRRKRKDEERARGRVKEQRKREHFPEDAKHHLPSLKVTLMGCKYAGKTSSVNTILGRKEVEPSNDSSSLISGEVAGRQLITVEAPGWWFNKKVRDSPELTKQNIKLSMSLCRPGPHAVLLVIFASASFTEHMKTAAREHMELLGKAVWNHTIVLFTHGDWLQDTTIEQYIESEGQTLTWLLNKCGNRYHVLNNQRRGDVTELLEKIEEMVAGNCGRLFEMNRQRLHDLEITNNRVKDRVRHRQRQRAHLPPQKDDVPPLQEIRVALLGCKWSGKTSSGDTVLGVLGKEEIQPEHGSATCTKREGEVAGRQVTVVEAPGWRSYDNLKDTPELIKEGIVHSVSLCSPGPHALLAVIPVTDSCTKERIRNIQEHLELLSKKVWSHTMVLFTYGDWLGDITIEQHIESEVALQSLVEKCGNRYHVLNNYNRGDTVQITQFLEKIEEMAQNQCPHYEIDQEAILCVEERREQQLQGIEHRRLAVYRRSATSRYVLSDLHLAEVRIVLLGSKRAGKSSSGNTILGREEFDLKRSTAHCVKRQGEVAGRQITVVEAPGWKKNDSIKDTHHLTKDEIVQSVSFCAPGPHVVLLVVRVDSSITRQCGSAMQEHLELLGENVWNHSLILFTYGDWLGDTSIEQYIESEAALQDVVRKCGNRYHVMNNVDRGDRTQVAKLLEKTDELCASNSGNHFLINKETNAQSQDLQRAADHRGECMEEMEIRSMSQPPTMSGGTRSLTSGIGTMSLEHPIGAGAARDLRTKKTTCPESDIPAQVKASKETMRKEFLS